MSSTSFNPIQVQASQVQTNQPLTLREGQVFHGTIKQLYPDQMAEVQVGANKFVAKLETPLKMGDAHFFQVTATGAQTELKIVTGPMTQNTPMNQQIQQLLQSMNLPKSKEMQQIMGHFLKEQIPISKDQLLSAELWMKNLPNGVTKQDALAAMQKMVELKMPFTQNVFNALTLGAKTDGMSAALQQFMQQLANAANINETTKTNLLQTLANISKPLEGEFGGTLLANAVRTLLNNNASPSNKLQTLNLLKEANILPKAATLLNWQNNNQQIPSIANSQQHFAGQIISNISTTKPEQTPLMIQQVQQWIRNEQLLSTDQKTSLMQLVNRFEQLPQTKQTIDLFAKQFKEQLLNAFANQQNSNMFAKNSNEITNKEHLLSLLRPEINQMSMDATFRNIVKVGQDMQQPFIQSQYTQAEASVQSQVDSKAMEQAIKNVMRGLGLSYEASLVNKASDIQALAQSLKPQLLNIIHDAQVSPTLRESADVLLARLNGVQLLSGENGHQHQLVMQVPLDFFGKRMEATLQWNGRMKDDGKIDPDFARVLFYLNMESMAETVVDMQVQNRIVTINVFNDSPQLAKLAEPLKQSLKLGLSNKEYHLSGVFIKPFEKEESSKPTEVAEDYPNRGVDIKI